MSSPGVYQLRWWQLLRRIVQEFATPLGLERGYRSKIRALTLDYKEADAAIHFKADILLLSELLPGNKALILLDEIEHITFEISPASHWTDDFLPFWRTLRSVHQDTRGSFGFVVAGVNPHALEADRVGLYDNPLFSTTKAFYLGPFDLATTREMVRRIGRFMGLRCEEPLYQRLFEEFGGHPFLVRQACSAVAKFVPDRPGELSLDLYMAHRDDIALNLERNIKQILNILAIWYPDEYDMVRILAQGDRKSFVEFANHSAEFTQHVEGYGLVREARTAPQISVGLVREFLARQPVKEAKAETEEDRLAEISRRRNRIEVALRDLLAQGLRFAEGQKAMNAASSALPTERRATLEQYSYDDFWQHLFFNELGSILEKNYSAFQKRISQPREKVAQWLDHINRCRADAHARSLSEEDFVFLQVCFRRWEEILELR